MLSMSFARFRTDPVVWQYSSVLVFQWIVLTVSSDTSEISGILRIRIRLFQ